jgi:hypothetical protein
MRALEIIWDIFFFFFSSLFQIFLCEASGRCVSGRPDSDLVCPDGFSSCLDDTADSFGRSFFLFGQACFCDLYVALRPDVT